MQTREERASAEAQAAIAAAPKTDHLLGSAEETQVSLPDGTILTFADRKGFGQSRQVLAYETRPGFHRHWFNDAPGNIEAALSAGYTPVTDARTGQTASRVVDKTTGMRAYLHEVPEVWYKADLEAAQKLADEKDSSIRRGLAPDPGGKSPLGSDLPKFYGGVKMGRRKGSA